MSRTETDDRLCLAWYVKYPLDAYALGPLRFAEPVSAARAAKRAEEIFGELPQEVWPAGPIEEGETYEYHLWEEVEELENTGEFA